MSEKTNMQSGINKVPVKFACCIRGLLTEFNIAFLFIRNLQATSLSVAQIMKRQVAGLLVKNKLEPIEAVRI
jgi:hypothetical protein